MTQSWYRRRGKRVLDLSVGISALLFAAPLIMTTALLVRVKLGRPVLFRQQRPGLNGKLFYICKFRTMTDERDERGLLLPDQQRLTFFGRFLRRSSLDELPQLWNVIRGDMSLVGPRPLLPDYLLRYSTEHSRRHLVRPGITGWAQVNGRRDRLFSERLKCDVWYVDHCSFMVDSRILLMTVINVFKGRGAHDDQELGDVDDLGLNEGVMFKRSSAIEQREAA